MEAAESAPALSWEAASVLGEALDEVIPRGLALLELQKVLTAATEGHERGSFLCNAYARAHAGTSDAQTEAKMAVVRLCNAGILLEGTRAVAEDRLAVIMQHWTDTGLQADGVATPPAGPNKAYHVSTTLHHTICTSK